MVVFENGWFDLEDPECSYQQVGVEGRLFLDQCSSDTFVLTDVATGAHCQVSGKHELVVHEGMSLLVQSDSLQELEPAARLKTRYCGVQNDRRGVAV